jgi:TPR repeat protein
MQDIEDRFNAIYDRIEDAWDEMLSDQFVAALSDLRLIAESGYPEAAEALAEILALPGPHQRLEEAYKWYFVAYAQQGYQMEFDDHNGNPPYYGGPVGDFRNEAQVSDLVTAIGFERCQELDSQASDWLKVRSVKTKSSA